MASSFRRPPSRIGELLAAVTECGLSGVRDLHPFFVGSCSGDVTVVPVPPFVRGRLRVAFRRVFPNFLAAERGDVEIAPCGTHRLVTAAVDEVGTKYLLAIAEEHIVPVPLVDAEIG